MTGDMHGYGVKRRNGGIDKCLSMEDFCWLPPPPFSCEIGVMHELGHVFVPIGSIMPRFPRLMSASPLGGVQHASHRACLATNNVCMMDKWTTRKTCIYVFHIYNCIVVPISLALRRPPAAQRRRPRREVRSHARRHSHPPPRGGRW
jgi:hypothetical protein